MASIMSSRPTAFHWTEYLDELTNWERFAIYLPGIEQHHVDKITKECSGVDNSKTALYSKWTRIYPQASWNHVLEALKKMKEFNLANKIEKQLEMIPVSQLTSQGNLSTSQPVFNVPAPSPPVLGTPMNQELDISQLDDIVTTLKKSYFSFGNWSKLGLKLGLYQPTLETIERNWPRDAERCLRECLTQWIQRDDGVDNKGGPTQAALVNALQNIDKAAAQKMKQYPIPQPIQHTDDNDIYSPQLPPVQQQMHYIPQTPPVNTGHTVRQRNIPSNNEQPCRETSSQSRPLSNNRNSSIKCSLWIILAVLVCFGSICILSIGCYWYMYFGVNSDCTKTLKKSQLADILQTLKEAEFSPCKWKNLGDHLGLHANTLESIKVDNEESADCLRECINIWLQRSDSVNSKGGPKWSTLVNALRIIEFNSSADYISEKYTCPS